MKAISMLTALALATCCFGCQATATPIDGVAHLSADEIDGMLPRDDQGFVSISAAAKYDEPDPAVLSSCIEFLKNRGYAAHRLAAAKIRWHMAYRDVLLLDVYTAGRGTAESARLIYARDKKAVLGFFSYGDYRK